MGLKRLVAALGEVLSQEATGVLVGAAQPGAGWVGEEDALIEVPGPHRTSTTSDDPTPHQPLSHSA